MQTPIAVQTKSWKGRIVASPEKTNIARAAIEARIPSAAPNIQAGKKAPNIANEGAPRAAHPFNVLKARDSASAQRLGR